jgi:hypothetical protein
MTFRSCGYCGAIPGTAGFYHKMGCPAQGHQGQFMTQDVSVLVETNHELNQEIARLREANGNLAQENFRLRVALKKIAGMAMPWDPDDQGMAVDIARQTIGGEA